MMQRWNRYQTKVYLKCPSCGRVFEVYIKDKNAHPVRYCEDDGALLRIYAPVCSCGRRLINHPKYCASCGEPVGELLRSYDIQWAQSYPGSW